MIKHELYHNGNTVVELLEWNKNDVIVRHHCGGEEIITRKYFEQNYTEVYKNQGVKL